MVVHVRALFLLFFFAVPLWQSCSAGCSRRTFVRAILSYAQKKAKFATALSGAATLVYFAQRRLRSNRYVRPLQIAVDKDVTYTRDSKFKIQSFNASEVLVETNKDASDKGVRLALVYEYNRPEHKENLSYEYHYYERTNEFIVRGSVNPTRNSWWAFWDWLKPPLHDLRMRISIPHDLAVRIEANPGTLCSGASIPSTIIVTNPGADVVVENGFGNVKVTGAASSVDVTVNNRNYSGKKSRLGHAHIHQRDGALGDIAVQAVKATIDNFAQNVYCNTATDDDDTDGITATRNHNNTRGTIAKFCPATGTGIIGGALRECMEYEGPSGAS